MENLNIKKLTDLMEYYSSLNCKSLKELSQVSYKLRESGIDIPYVTIDGTITPTSKQKNWIFLENERRNLRNGLTSTKEGYTMSLISNLFVGSLHFIILNKRNKKVENNIMYMDIQVLYHSYMDNNILLSCIKDNLYSNAIVSNIECVFRILDEGNNVISEIKDIK